MKWKEIFSERSFWSLLIINVSIIIYYYYNHTGFKTLVWIYWMQSVLIGFFTFLQLATMKKMESPPIKLLGEYASDSMKARGVFATFFAFHFGFFHFVYFIFIFTITESKEIFDWNLFQYSVGAFALDQLWNFIQLKQLEKEKPLNAGAIFFLPYARIVPMHLTILIPAFFGFIPQMGLFLVLKLFADLVMNAFTIRIYGKPKYDDPVALRTIK